MTRRLVADGGAMAVAMAVEENVAVEEEVATTIVAIITGR